MTKLSRFPRRASLSARDESSFLAYPILRYYIIFHFYVSLVYSMTRRVRYASEQCEN